MRTDTDRSMIDGERGSEEQNDIKQCFTLNTPPLYSEGICSSPWGWALQGHTGLGSPGIVWRYSGLGHSRNRNFEEILRRLGTPVTRWHSKDLWGNSGFGMTLSGILWGRSLQGLCLGYSAFKTLWLGTPGTFWGGIRVMGEE